MNRRKFFGSLAGLFAMNWLPWKKTGTAIPRVFLRDWITPEELEEKYPSPPLDEQFERLILSTGSPRWRWEPTAWEDIEARNIIRRMSDPDRHYAVVNVVGMTIRGVPYMQVEPLGNDFPFPPKNLKWRPVKT